MTRLSPKEYADKYANMRVYLFTDEQAKATTGTQLPAGGAWETVALTSYRLGLNIAWKAKKTDPDRKSLDKFTEKLRPYYSGKTFSITVWVMNATSGNLEVRTYTDRDALAENIVDPFYGKGSPEECQVVLQLGVRYGIIQRDQVQLYCNNRNIGLDCNGFVGNYLRHVVQDLSWHTDAHDKKKMTAFDASADIGSIITFTDWIEPVTTLDDFTTWSQMPVIMAMANEKTGGIVGKYIDDDGNEAVGHIVITEPGTAVTDKTPAGVFGKSTPEKSLRVDVWESTGGMGLTPSQYYILPPNKHGVSNVWRGSKQKTMYVRMGRLKK